MKKKMAPLCFFTDGKKPKAPKLDMIILSPFKPKSDLTDFTLSNARRFYSSKGDPLGMKGLEIMHCSHT